MDALKVIEGGNVDALMADLGRRARVAAQRVALASAEEKDAALRAMAVRIRADERAILAANAEDLADARDKGQSGAFIDRLAPSDRVAVAGFGIGAPSTAFTADRERIKQVIGRMFQTYPKK